MSRAREIQEKLDLQAKIQLSFANQSSKVSSWLTTGNDTIETNKNNNNKDNDNDLKTSQNDFFHLPVVQMGSGLNMEESDDVKNNQSDIHTVGEFIKSDKKIQSLAKKRQYKQSNDSKQNSYVRNNIHRIAKDDTKAMVALKRKMRKDIISKQRNNNPTPSNNNNHNNSSDDDDDEDDRNSRTKHIKKKTMGLLFQSKKDKKK